ncbi:MAG: GNAT family N-acetyltransferase [Rickettsiales bacterium]|nr:GNAT family N-acetyltransferase [Rickettsiales bacterium]
MHIDTEITVVDANSQDFKKCLAIRKTVFIIGQNVPEEIEIDGLDKYSVHYMISTNHTSVGTARVRYLDKQAKIERVAVLSGYQGQGIGKKLMQFIIKDIKESKAATTIFLSSQVHAICFYQNLGFNICSQEYLDANIPHKDMKISI